MACNIAFTEKSVQWCCVLIAPVNQCITDSLVHIKCVVLGMSCKLHTKRGALDCALTPSTQSLSSPCAICLGIVLEGWNRMAEIKGLLWHFWHYYCLLYLQFFPLGCFHFALLFLCCFDVYAQCHVFSSVLRKGTSTSSLGNV